MTFNEWWKTYKWPSSYSGSIEKNLAMAAWDEGARQAQARAQVEKDFILKIIDLCKSDKDAVDFSNAVGELCEQYLKGQK